MIITRDNYEPYFLDYLEGKLEENMIDEFLDFLEQNPDLKEELHLFENIHLPEEELVYSGKKHLYKSSAEEKSAFEMKAVACMEGDLGDEERESFEAYLASHPELQREYDLFEKTRLVADTHVQYPRRQQLYRKSGTILLMNWVARAAAVALLLWGINSLFQPGSPTRLPSGTEEIATVKPQPAPPVLQTTEPEVKAPATKKDETLASSSDPKPAKPTRVNTVTTTPAENIRSAERDLTVLEEIQPILASLEREDDENQLAVSKLVNFERIRDPRNGMTLEEFLASRAKKVGDGGWLSANRILRTGLNVASELSGDRIGYKVKNGKISSLDFESRLMAFSIPLQKK
jgi:hypothetical protein